MKLFAILIAALALGACSKSSNCANGVKDGDEVGVDCGGDCPPCTVSYPATGSHGINLLHGTDTLVITGSGNSFKANIPDGSSLKVEMNLIYGRPWVYENNVGWSISTYYYGYQKFDAINGGNVDAQMVWSTPDSGMIAVSYYENGTTRTSQKIIMKEGN
ncbi:MAG: hypothetical protein NXI09_04590 [Bacteroidetes bacterium]|nr:hypothetical protein [Bacteroidota bacterium]